MHIHVAVKKVPSRLNSTRPCSDVDRAVVSPTTRSGCSTIRALKLSRYHDSLRAGDDASSITLGMPGLIARRTSSRVPARAASRRDRPLVRVSRDAAFSDRASRYNAWLPIRMACRGTLLTMVANEVWSRIGGPVSEAKTVAPATACLR